MGELTAADLYQRLAGTAPPRVLDVRNAQEFARWRVEGPHPVDVLNVPYFEFVEREEASVRKVTDWLGGRPGDLVVVCAEGGSSAYVTEILRGQGLAAANLAGGMVAWGLGAAVRRVSPSGPARLWQVLRFGRGCLSYVVARGQDAVVVDPHRRLDVYRGLLEREGLHLRAVFDTHLHADHVSGGPALARESGVPYHASPRDFEGATLHVEGLTDGQPVRIGQLEVLPIVPLGTPGHTPGSTSLLVGDASLLTGDTLFVDDVGRPDLGGQAACGRGTFTGRFTSGSDRSATRSSCSRLTRAPSPSARSTPSPGRLATSGDGTVPCNSAWTRSSARPSTRRARPPSSTPGSGRSTWATRALPSRS